MSYNREALDEKMKSDVIGRISHVDVIRRDVISVKAKATILRTRQIITISKRYENIRRTDSISSKSPHSSVNRKNCLRVVRRNFLNV